MTGIGAVAVRQPRVRNREADSFSPTILPLLEPQPISGDLLAPSFDRKKH